MGRLPRRMRRERFALWRGFAGWCSELVAGEETRSREAGQHTQMAARHLVPLRAALESGDAVDPGCRCGEIHGVLCLCG
jgi:hypothetical protein